MLTKGLDESWIVHLYGRSWTNEKDWSSQVGSVDGHEVLTFTS